MPRNRWIENLRWVRTGQQDRSRRTQEALLRAAAELLADKGVEATSVADVAARAGCSVGSVYHHFRDKKTLLVAVFDRMQEEVRVTTTAALDPERWVGASIEDLLRAYLEFSIEMARERPSFKHAGLAVAETEASLRDHLAELRIELFDGLRGLIFDRRSEIGHPDPAVAVDFVLEQLASMLTTRLEHLAAPTPFSGRSHEEFVDEALASASRYLQLQTTSERKR